jgi:general secretion pathway protein L
MLIIALPHDAHAANTGYAHVHSDGHRVLRSATGAAATLSNAAGEVVAVVPHSRLSWLPVTLPPASHGPRLAAVLQGLLEDRLLDDAQQLHRQAHGLQRSQR